MGIPHVFNKGGIRDIGNPPNFWRRWGECTETKTENIWNGPNGVVFTGMETCQGLLDRYCAPPLRNEIHVCPNPVLAHRRTLYRDEGENEYLNVRKYLRKTKLTGGYYQMTSNFKFSTFGVHCQPASQPGEEDVGKRGVFKWTQNYRVPTIFAPHQMVTDNLLR